MFDSQSEIDDSVKTEILKPKPPPKQDEPVDSAGIKVIKPGPPQESDSLDRPGNDIFVDSTFIGPIDPTLIEELINLPEPPPFRPYYKTYITQKGIGDILRYRTGIFVLQHGLVGHPEMITKSLMLPGTGTIYNGIPVFHQGCYFPFRAGADLTVLMSDNISGLGIAPISYLSLFAEGEILLLHSNIWPNEDSPSSVSHARGYYEYKRTSWRFSRRLRKNIGVTFTAAFKKYSGYYTDGDDYDDFRISSTAAWRPKTNLEFSYEFYQHKAKQGVVQFDRLISPTTRSHNDINHHVFKTRYQYSNSLLLTLDSYFQYNYNHIYDDIYDQSIIVRDRIIGGIAGAEFVYGKNNFKINSGWQNQQLQDIGSYEPVSSTFGLTVSDSLQLAESQAAIVTGRLRYNNKTDLNLAGTARYRLRNITFSAGTYDSQPDLYAMYYSPSLVFSSQSIIKSYTYIPDSDIESKNTMFGAADIELMLLQGVSANLGASYEHVTNDLVSMLYAEDSVYTSTQVNVDYDRITLTADLDYRITRFFTGRTGVTYFRYDPSEVMSGIKYSPSLVAFSLGELLIPEVLRDIDISGAFQVRYYSKRYYSGFITKVLSRKAYKQAIVVDGSLAMRFGSFEFRISEDNIADFFVDNNYNLWGEYSMSPAVVWWQFNWNFID